MILITSPEKPLLRTPKGSIQKKATIKAYGAEIDALYVLSSLVYVPFAYRDFSLETDTTLQKPLQSSLGRPPGLRQF